MAKESQSADRRGGAVAVAFGNDRAFYREANENTYLLEMRNLTPISEATSAHHIGASSTELVTIVLLVPVHTHQVSLVQGHPETLSQREIFHRRLDWAA